MTRTLTTAPTTEPAPPTTLDLTTADLPDAEPDVAPEIDFANSGAAELAALKADPDIDEVTLALTEFSWFFGPVDGAREITVDASRPPSATNALGQVIAIWDQIDDDRRMQVAERVLAIVGDPNDDDGSSGIAGPTPMRRRSSLHEDQYNGIAGIEELFLEGTLGGNSINHDIEFTESSSVTVRPFLA